MATINQYFEFSQLAQASYSSLSPEDLNVVIVGALKDQDGAGFTQQQAEAFATGYTVLSQSAPNANGFSATLFQNNATGQKTLAIRGTQLLDVGDLVTDVFVATLGLSNQYASLKAYYQQLITEGKLGAAETFSVTGHSLGGFLAQSFAVDYVGNVSQTYTYNAPGIGGIVADVLSAVGVTATNISVANITNIIAQPGLSATAGLGTMLGNVQNVFIEQQTNPLNNHKIGFLTDALALYDLFVKIDSALNTTDPAVGIGKITGILKAASNQPAPSLEAALDSLRILFTDPIAPNPALTPTDNRDQFYQNLFDSGFQGRIASYANQLSFMSLVGTEALTIEANAFAEIGYRYALKELNPFAIVGNNNLYAPHNQNGELDLYNLVTGQGTLTAAYLADRSAMLAWKNLDYTADGQKVLTSNRIETYQFIDKTLKDTFGNDLTFTVRGSQLGSVGIPAKVIFGGDAADSLMGGNVYAGDRLYGGGGADTLQGNQGNDYLEGGNGFDTYVYVDGDGYDTIFDTDGQGQLQIDGIAITGGIHVSDNVFLSVDKQHFLHFDGDLTTGGTLIVDGQTRIEGFRNGDLGIALSDTIGLPEIQPTTLTFMDPFFPSPTIGFGSDGADYVEIRYGNNFVAKGGDDLLVVSTDQPGAFLAGPGDDLLIGGDYNLWGAKLYGEAGADIILGGENDERISGDFDFFFAQDWFEFPSFYFSGGYTSDDFSGVGGWGFEGDSFPEEEYGTANPFYGTYRDALKYVLGISESTDINTHYDDYIDGGAGNDVIAGGYGSDIIYGGTGDDTIWADDRVFFDTDHSRFGLPEWLADALPWFGSSGDDFIDGGPGNDTLGDHPHPNVFGFSIDTGGNDVFIGGAGDDIINSADRITSIDATNFLYGDDGNDEISSNNFSGGRDYLFGGDGDDVLTVFYSLNAYLDGGGGNDLYQVGLDYAQNIIINNNDGASNGIDRLQLMRENQSAITFNDIRITRDKSNIYFGDKDVLDRVAIIDWFSGDANKVDEISLYDGYEDIIIRSFTAQTLEALFSAPTSGDDFLWASSSNDRMEAADGNDTLAGNAGNDFLDGGAGNDTYVFDLGGGVDTIQDSAGVDTLAFGADITPDMLTLGLGSLLIRVGDGGDAIHIEGFNPSDVYGSPMIENFAFADGTVLAYNDLLARGFDLTGTQSNDVIIGTNIEDRINGLAGNDILNGGDGADVIDGGTGDDILIGGPGNDTYRFGRGSGVDRIEDAVGVFDTLELGMGITPTDVTVTRGADTLTLAINGTADQAVLRWQPEADYRIERVTFADGTTWDTEALEARAVGTANTPPAAVVPVLDQTVLEDTPLIFTLPSDAFFDPDANDALTFSATLANGSPLPAWLTFDPTIRAFTGMPGNDEVGTLSVTVTVTDTGNARAADTFDLTVVNVNDAPVVNNSIVNQYIADGDAMQFQLPVNTFNDIDVGDTLGYTAALAAGSPLPAWLAFDAATRTFSGMPDEADIGATSINVTARDGSGATASDSFDLTVTVAPDKTLMGTGDDDLLAGRSGNDTLDGLAGDDALFGRSGNDRLTGGLGDDLLVGGKGNDTYVYRPGDGLDMVADEAGSDAVAFGTGLTRANVVARMSEDNTTARVRVLDAYGNEQAGQGLDVALGADGQSPIEWFTFANGDSASLDDLLIRKEVHTGTRRNDVIRTGRNDDTIYAERGNDVVYAGSGHDMLFGDRGRDVLYGEAGNDALVGDRGKDKLYGGYGDDLLEGGRGSDLLDGGAGFNTYVFEGGFGDDRIVSSGGSGALRFGAGITARDLSFKRRDNDLVIKVHDGGRIRIESWFDSEAAHPVERAEFADGTVLNADEFVAKGYDYERERDEDDDDEDGSHDAHDDDGSRPHGATHNKDHDDVRPSKAPPDRNKNSEIPDSAWFEKVVEKWNAHYARSAQPNAESGDARSGQSHGAQIGNRWQHMHNRLNAHLADGQGDDDNGGADLASLKPGSAHGPSFAQFGSIGYGGVGVQDRGAADLRPFAGLKEGLARIA